eukprot:3089530-Amphidinium_carterae.1
MKCGHLSDRATQSLHDGSVMSRSIDGMFQLQIPVQQPWLVRCMPHFSSLPGYEVHIDWQRQEAWVPQLARSLSDGGVNTLDGLFGDCSLDALGQTLQSWRCLDRCQDNNTVMARDWEFSILRPLYDCCVVESTNCPLVYRKVGAALSEWCRG